MKNSNILDRRQNTNPQAGLQLLSKKTLRLVIPKKGEEKKKQPEIDDENEDEGQTNLKIAWVSRWIDLTYKYGLGFQLNNGLIGVFYNDNTKMISYTDKTVKYLHKPPGQKNLEKEVVVIYDIESFP